MEVVGSDVPEPLRLGEGTREFKRERSGSRVPELVGPACIGQGRPTIVQPPLDLHHDLAEADQDNPRRTFNNHPWVESVGADTFLRDTSRSHQWGNRLFNMGTYLAPSYAAHIGWVGVRVRF